MKHRAKMRQKRLLKLTKSRIRLLLNPSRFKGVCHSLKCVIKHVLEEYFGDGLQMNVVDGEL